MRIGVYAPLEPAGSVTVTVEELIGTSEEDLELPSAGSQDNKQSYDDCAREIKEHTMTIAVEDIECAARSRHRVHSVLCCAG